MISYKIFGIILLNISGLLAQQTSDCFDGYCYSSDLTLKIVTSLKDGQDYCTNNDSSSWLLELYNVDQALFVTSKFVLIPVGSTSGNPVLLNTKATITIDWISDSGLPFPSGFTIDESQGKDYLYVVNISGVLNFCGTNNSFYPAYVICRYAGNCPGGYCYFNGSAGFNWFQAQSFCYQNPGNIIGGSGHMLNFDGMTYSQAISLSVMYKLEDKQAYFLGYSRLYYMNLHSNTRNYMIVFDNSYPLQSSTRPTEIYYNFLKEYVLMADELVVVISSCMAQSSAASIIQFEVLKNMKLVKKNKFISKHVNLHECFAVNLELLSHNKIVLTANETTEASTQKPGLSQSTILLSVLLPTLLWMVFSIFCVFLFLPLYVKRKTRIAG